MFFDIDSPFTMVVLIVLIAVGAGVINNYLKLKSKQSDTSVDAEELARLKDEVSLLKERVRVLEQITTDKDRRLSDEISRLA